LNESSSSDLDNAAPASGRIQICTVRVGGLIINNYSSLYLLTTGSYR
jgi:hypothetical protein